MNSFIKNAIVFSVTNGLVNNIMTRMLPNFSSIFMLHRMENHDEGIFGDNKETLESALIFLRKQNYVFLSVEELVMHLIKDEPLPRKSVAFSFDDGYWDQAEIAGELMAKYDCPATYFVTTGFIDNQVWFWDSKIQFLLENSERRLWDNVGLILNFEINISDNLKSVVNKASARLKKLNISSINSKLDEISRILELPIPDKAPRKYGPMSIDQMKALQQKGMKIGPHSVSHPILANEDDAFSQYEIVESWNRLLQMIDNPSPVFCYPVGRHCDFSEREERTIRASEMIGAVSANPGYIEGKSKGQLESLPRFGFPGSMADFRQYATWFEVFKDKLRDPGG